MALICSGCLGAGRDAIVATPSSSTSSPGAIEGTVLTDAGDPLKGIHVVLLGQDHVDFTDDNGRFGFSDLAPGAYTVRADGTGWRAVERAVDVAAGQLLELNLSLVPRDPLAMESPHSHDYWNGQQELIIADSDFRFHRNEAGTTYGEASRMIAQYGRTAYTEECNGPYSSSASEFYFADPAQIVIPGTARMKVTLSWTASDAPSVQGLAIGWKHPSDGGHNLSGLVPNGQTFEIDVDPKTWDDAHQRFTLWQFWACLAGKGEEVQGYGPSGRTFPGSYHVRIVLVGGADIKVDPPHPRFWDNGSEVRVLDSWANITCASQSELCGATHLALGSLNGRANNYVFHRTPSRLVPPGTKELRVQIEWRTDLPTSQAPLSVTYSAADVPPRHKGTQADYEVMDPVEKGDQSRAYVLALTPTQTDGFYQSMSNWRFLWNVEGQESEATYIHSCACRLTIHIQVTAVKDDDYAQTVSGSAS